MNDTIKLEQALSGYKTALAEYAHADTQCDAAKKMFECKVAAMVIEAEGSSQAEKERYAKASEVYNEELRVYLNKLHLCNTAKAKRLGAEAEYETERSKLSYNKSLIDKGIIS